MFVKVLVLALAVTAINATFSTYNTFGTGIGGLSSYALGGVPVYRSSALYGGSLGGIGLGYGSGLAGIGAYGLGSGLIGANKVAVGGLGLRGLGLGYGGFAANQGVHAVNAAVINQGRTVDYRAVPFSGEPIIPQVVDVPPSEQPVQINFQSKSSPLIVSQQHIAGEPGQVQVTQSEDEPQRLIHTVNKPVIQEVNEVIQPYRQLNQQIEPVIESGHTTVSQGEGARITGLQSGIIGGTGQLAASGIGYGVGLGGIQGLGLAGAYGTGLGLAGVKTVGVGGLYGTGLGLAGVRGLGIGGVNTYGLGGLYGKSVYGTGLGSLGGYGSVYGSGLGLGGLGSVYSNVAKIARF